MSDNEELKAEAAAEMAADANEPEVIHIDEEDINEANKDSKTWTEEMQMAGGEVVGFLQKIGRESIIRRVIVKNSDGRVLLDLPILLGAAGLLPPVFIYTVIALGVALFTRCTIVIERSAVDEPVEEPVTEAAG